MIFLFVVGAWFGLAGGLAYTGRYRSWTASYIFRPYYMLGGLWMGLGLWAIALAILVRGHGWSVLSSVFYVVFLGCAVIFLMSVFWLPKLLRPAWFRAWQDNGSRRTEYARPFRSLMRRRG